jgi:hypothetical protein
LAENLAVSKCDMEMLFKDQDTLIDFLEKGNMGFKLCREIRWAHKRFYFKGLHIKLN